MPTTIGLLDLRATFECVSIYSNFIGDPGGNNQAIAEYRESGGIWKPAHDLIVDRRETVYAYSPEPNPYVNQWRGSIIGLRPNTEYEVRVAYTDPDGLISLNPVVGNIRTRNDVFPLGTGTIFYVATNGNDLNPGTEALPFRTIQRAANVVAPGDIVLIREGIYHEELYFQASGVPNNYITFRSYGLEKVVIDADNVPNVLLIMNRVSYNRLAGLELRNAKHAIISLQNRSNYNVLEDLILDDFGYEVPDAGVGICSGSAYNLVQRFHISSDRTVNPDSLHRADGVCMWRGTYPYDVSGPGEGNVIRHGVITSRNRGISDGVGGNENAKIMDGPYKDCDIYGLTVTGNSDDGLELEGGDINVRAWGNRINNPMTTGMGHTHPVVGPLYVFRNIFYDMNYEQVAVKVGNNPGSDGPVFAYHNTYYTAQGKVYGLGDWGGGNWKNLTYRNNIIQVTRRIVSHTRGTIAQTEGTSFDYNCAMTGGYGTESFYKFANIAYQNFAAWQAAGHEAHGIFTDAQFVNPASGDLRLRDTSPCLNRGLVIPNFNDKNSPWPFDGPAPDLGAIESGIVTIPPIADFDYNPATGNAPLTVQFVDLSTGEIDSLNWNFGDGAPTESAQNPSHVYTTPGVYTVTLVVTGPGGSNAMTITDAITVLSGPGELVNITVEVLGNGSTAPIPGVYPQAGGIFTITADPDPGSRFLEWRQDGVPISISATLELIVGTVDTTITAVFELIPQYILEIAATPGGSVIRNPDLPTYNEGTAVVITALPASGYRFVEWLENGVSLSTNQQIQVIMDANKAITASFEEVIVPPNEFAVSISSLGQGDTIPPEDTYQVTDGSWMTVEAIPHDGYEFAYWAGDVSGTENPLPLFQVTSNMTIIAVFTEKPPAAGGGVLVIGAAAGAALILIIALLGFTQRR